MAGVGGATWLEWVGLHGWCGRGCMAGVGRGFIASVGGAVWYERDCELRDVW